MTATDELRRLLDERGVEWKEPNNMARSHTTYWTAGFLRCIAVEFNDGMVSIASSSGDITPEQAIEATLGGDLKAENAELRQRIKELEECIRGDADGIYRLAKNTGYLHTDELMESIHNRMRELGVEV